MDEMRVRLQGARVFTKLDIKSAFHHLLLDRVSRPGDIPNRVGNKAI
jgi:hypothetical protein